MSILSLESLSQMWQRNYFPITYLLDSFQKHVGTNQKVIQVSTSLNICQFFEQVLFSSRGKDKREYLTILSIEYNLYTRQGG